MDLGIKRKVALVTGAATGIGEVTAVELLDEGAVVVLSDKDSERLEKTAEQYKRHDAFKGRVFSCAADQTDVEAIKKLHEFVKAEVGTIDILVQNAGISGEQGLFHELDNAIFEQVMDVNFMGSVRIIREFLPDLRANGWGRIVLLSSENAVQPYADELPYNASKAAMLAFGKGLSQTYAEEGLLVNVVSPAFIESDMTDQILGRQRIEHVDHARNSGKQVGEIMAGGIEVYTHTPYFYSEISDLSWEAIGTMDPELEPLFDEREDGKIVFFLEEDVLKGVLLGNVEVDLDDVRELLDNPPAKEDLVGKLEEREEEDE